MYVDDRALGRLLRQVAKQFESPDAIGLGLAGARHTKDRARADGGFENPAGHAV